MSTVTVNAAGAEDFLRRLGYELILTGLSWSAEYGYQSEVLAYRSDRQITRGGGNATTEELAVQDAFRRLAISALEREIAGASLVYRLFEPSLSGDLCLNLERDPEALVRVGETALDAAQDVHDPVKPIGIVLPRFVAGRTVLGSLALQAQRNFQDGGTTAPDADSLNLVQHDSGDSQRPSSPSEEMKP
ncbi:MAG: hypothetical protein ACYCW6_00180 [Candidatus Xenobia bacterium]